MKIKNLLSRFKKIKKTLAITIALSCLFLFRRYKLSAILKKI